MESPRWASATELVEAYRSGALSPVETTRDVLEAVELINPSINAFCLVDGEAALASAAKSELRWRQGAPLSGCDGVPTSIKDLVFTSGWPTLRGSHLIQATDDEWSEDAPTVARLRESGAVLVGKVTSPEFGWKGVTDSPRFGVTTNPWDTTRTAGGSSGGSAAAVAQGLGQFSVGTDGGGSIRIPAGFCGVVGFKPTYGTVPIYPASPFGTLSHAGPITRTVPDAALMMDVLSRYDARDWSALAPPVESFSGRLAASRNVSGLRVAFSPDLGYGRNDPEVDALVRQAASRLEELGAHVEEVSLELEDPVWAYHILWFSGAAMVVDSYGAGAAERIDPKLRAALARHKDFTARDFLDATALRTQLGRRMGLFHEQYDVLLTPTLPGVAFEAGADVPAGSASEDWTSWTPYTYPFNLTQQPAITVPCGFTGEGLPVGLQIVGPRHADARVLGVAAAYEAAEEWVSRRPPQPADFR